MLTFGLLLSDYMSRQVLSAVFPFLKVEWSLTDTQLGGLTSIVALTVGLLAVPLSLLGDRWGRSKAIVSMGALWSLATLGSAVAANYDQMMLARFFIGLGEAAYGSVGLAVVLMVFAPSRRASLTGAFMAGGSFGSVLGVFLGGILAVQLGWRWSFGVMALVGLVLVVLYLFLVSDAKLARHQHPGNIPATPTTAASGKVQRAKLRTLVSTPSVVCAYVGSGLQLFVVGALFAWMPSYLNRAYGLAPDKAGIAAAGFILLMGVGMIVCGMITDRLTLARPIRKWTTALVYASLSLVLLPLGFALAPGALQLVLIAVGRLLRRRDHGSGWRHGGEPDPVLDPGHRVRDVDARQQPARPRRRSLRGRSPRRPPRADRRDEDRPPGLGPGDHSAAHRTQGLPEQHPPRPRSRLGLNDPHHERSPA